MFILLKNFFFIVKLNYFNKILLAEKTCFVKSLYYIFLKFDFHTFYLCERIWILGATANPGNPAATGPAGPAQQQPQAQPQAQQAAAQNGGQADYSAQWAEYYRSIGKIKEAEAIEAQMKAGKVQIVWLRK